MLRSAVILSVVLGFVGSEFLGLLSGGLVSAGYLAYYFNQPLRVCSTLVLAILICLIVKALQNVMIIYGRRRFFLTILVGILLSQVMEALLVTTSAFQHDFRIIGYLIPGLIANDMEKQGVLRTLLMCLACAAIIWLCLQLGAML